MPSRTWNRALQRAKASFLDSGMLVHNSCNHNSKWAKEPRSNWKNTATTVREGKNYGAYTATQENISRMKRGLAPKGWLFGPIASLEGNCG